MKCLFCQKEVKSFRGLSKHIKSHNIIPETYTLKYIYDNIHPICKCGCGQKTFYANGKYCFNDYIHNHHKPTLGCKMSDETKIKISKKQKKHQQSFTKNQRQKNAKVWLKKSRATCLKRYGVENLFSSPDIQKKIKENRDIKQIFDKAKQTNLEKYGVEYPFQLLEIQNKVKNTHLKKYGGNPMNSKEIKNKVKTTNIKKYGNPSSLHGTNQKKIEEIFLKKYGVECPSKNKEIKQKIKIANLLNWDHNDDINKNSIKKICEEKKYIPLFKHKEYQGNKQYLPFLCLKHDKIFKTCIFNMQQARYSCPSCKNSGVSKMEKEVVSFVKSIYSGEIIENSRQIISPYEIDIWIPDKNLGIEFCGLYWHSSANPKFKRNLHRNKTKMMHEQGCDLFLFFEDEWLNKRHLIEQMIKYRLGLVEKKVYARKCKVVEFKKNKDIKDFFEKNHLDGHTSCSGGYYLEYEGEILAAISIRTNFRGETEIARFATNCDYVVPGAGSKLISFLKRPIVTFSNNRLSRGDLYKNYGFKEITKTTSPSYWYTDLEVRVWRFKCKRLNPGKDNITQEEFNKFPTEISQATNGVFSRKIFGDERPLYRIEDCSHRKWILE